MASDVDGRMRPASSKPVHRAAAGKRGPYRWAMLFGLISVAALGAWWAMPREERPLEAKVVASQIVTDEDLGTRTLLLDIELAGGQRARAKSRWLLPPPAGAAITVRERTSFIGYRSYTWERTAPPAAPSAPGR